MVPRSLKYITVALILILLIGFVALSSSCHQKGVFIKKEIFHKQLLWLALGCCFLLLIGRLDYHRLSLFVWPLYGLLIICLLSVLLLGRTIMGAQRWLSLGIFSFQPSEIGKIILIIVLARYYSRKSDSDVQYAMEGLDFKRSVAIPFGIMLLPAVLVLIEPDLGTTIVYLFIFFFMAFVAKVRIRYLVSLASAAVLLMPIFWHLLKDYQKSRLLVFLNPNMDPLGAGYTMIQSKIAIGSGRLFGKGWMSGTQSQLNFLAERHTDFIFSVIGEEWGLLGGFLLLFLYGVLLFEILKIAQRAKDRFGTFLATGIAFLIFFQVYVNIAMNIGICPVVGLPLPFVSYGGSSFVVSLAALGIIFSIARQK